MWLRHGGLEQLSTLGGQLTAIGQLTGLYGTYLALIQLVLMSRSPWLDQAFGMDGLARRASLARLRDASGCCSRHGIVHHRSATALGDGSERRRGVRDAHHDLPVRADGRSSAAACSRSWRSRSIQAARRRLSYETWYGLHLYAYLAIALGFLHQLFVGADFIHDPIAVGYWIALYVATVGAHPRLPRRAADPDVGPAPAARLERRRRGARASSRST